MTYKYALDPSLFLWDAANYETLKTEYYEISSFLIDVITVIEVFPVCITQEIVRVILDRFPFASVYEFYEHRDLVTILCHFLSNLLSSPDIEFPEPNGICMV